MIQNFESDKKTLEYYQSKAKDFFDNTVWIDLNDLYQPFLELIPKTGIILDAGCGSGRDTRFFMHQGLKVIAFDNSSKMVKLASDFTGRECLHLSFEEIEFKNKFHGVWACSSLLHVPKNRMLHVLGKLNVALKPAGIMYISFKYGDAEFFKDGRHFSNYTEKSFTILLAKLKGIDIIRYWKTSDLRPGRKNEKWLNILLKKTIKY